MKYRVLSSRIAGAKSGSVIELPANVNVAALIAAGHVAPVKRKESARG
jgi:hypothetical protein